MARSQLGEWRAGGRAVQWPVLHPDEINSSKESAWRKSIEVLEEG